MVSISLLRSLEVHGRKQELTSYLLSISDYQHRSCHFSFAKMNTEFKDPGSRKQNMKLKER